MLDSCSPDCKKKLYLITIPGTNQLDPSIEIIHMIEDSQEALGPLDTEQMFVYNHD
jgi:hypothetical protein